MDLSASTLQDVERFLLTVIDESYFMSISLQYCTVILEIFEVGSWIIKYNKKMGLIVNNREIVLRDVANIDATFWFRSCDNFWEMVYAGANFNEEMMLMKNMRVSGLPEAIQLFKRSCVKSLVDIPPTSPPVGVEQSNAAIILSRGVGPRLPMPPDGSQPLKAGWLLKKRDILSGWRCRYFVVYKGRVEYYVDQHDLQPRQVVLLSGAEVQPYKRVSVNGMGEYWGLIIETKQKEKVFRLASELTGVEGKVEASSWETVFKEASRMEGRDSMQIQRPGSRRGGTSPSQQQRRLSNHQLGRLVGELPPEGETTRVRTASDMSGFPGQDDAPAGQRTKSRWVSSFLRYAVMTSNLIAIGICAFLALEWSEEETIRWLKDPRLWICAGTLLIIDFLVVGDIETWLEMVSVF